MTISTDGSAAVVDALNTLLESEQGSLFRFMDEGSPYLSRATAEIRKPLAQMVKAGQRRVLELAEMIDQLGGLPLAGGIQSEEQYLAFLTLKFLLPRLIEAKKLMIERYETTLKAVGNSQPQVAELLRSHLAEHQADLATLQKVYSARNAGK